jgi:hypothetical protein
VLMVFMTRLIDIFSLLFNDGKMFFLICDCCCYLQRCQFDFGKGELDELAKVHYHCQN